MSHQIHDTELMMNAAQATHTPFTMMGRRVKREDLGLGRALIVEVLRRKGPLTGTAIAREIGIAGEEPACRPINGVDAGNDGFKYLDTWIGKRNARTASAVATNHVTHLLRALRDEGEIAPEYGCGRRATLYRLADDEDRRRASDRMLAEQKIDRVLGRLRVHGATADQFSHSDRFIKVDVDSLVKLLDEAGW